MTQVYVIRGVRKLIRRLHVSAALGDGVSTAAPVGGREVRQSCLGSDLLHRAGSSSMRGARSQPPARQDACAGVTVREARRGGEEGANAEGPKSEMNSEFQF